MKILVIGHGRHGKDTVAELLRDMYGFTFMSSSRAVMVEAVWPVMKNWLRGGHPVSMYQNAEECFADRHNHREKWKQLISDYNTPDKEKLAKHILRDRDVYVGMRCALEYQACVNQRVFDKVIWVHRPGFPIEPEMDIQFDNYSMVPVVNSGSLDLLRDQLRKIFGDPVPPEPLAYTCKFCGAPSEVDTSDQTAPADYCHDEDHRVA